MNKHVSGTSVWFTSALFDRTDIRSYPQHVDNSVEKSAVSCGNTWDKPQEHPVESTVPQKNLRLCHGFSTKHGGVSRETYLSDLNFGFSVGEAREITQENYRRFANTLGINPSHLLCADQTHTSHVLTVTDAHRGLRLWETPSTAQPPEPYSTEGWDALVTNTPNVALTIRVADCVPILFWDPVHQVIGAAHAGWKGTFSRIAAHTVDAMEKIGAARKTILACIGHAIGVCCYEIDDAFYDRFMEAFGADTCKQIFLKSIQFANPDRYHCDLRALNRILLQKAGLPADHIETSALCTCCNPALFHSHRYAGQYQNGRRGLMAAMIAMETDAVQP